MSGYVGRGIEYGNAVADHFTGDGGATYTLSYDTVTDGVVVSLDGVVQKNGTDFNVTGTSLVFTSVVANPIAIQVIYNGLTLTYPVPSDNSVTSSKIADNQVTLAKMAGGTDGQIITYDASGDPVAVGPGSDGQVLTSTGAGSPPAFEAIPSDITKSTSEPAADTNPSGGVGTLWLRTTTGEMYCLTDATADANVWTNIGDGAGTQPYTMSAGGTITTDGDYKVHTFNTSATFTVNDGAISGGYEYLVIAGGGAGGSYGNPGGGGAGGYLTGTLSSLSSASYSITVGAGGASVNYGGYNSGLSPGTNSIFSSVTANGGGGGSSGNVAGQNGGSGGGGNGGYKTAGGTGSQGSNGGAGASGSYGGGGGGGSSTAGQQPTAPNGGNGGSGTASSISGSAVTRAGGGGGSREGSGTFGTGGSGGGGAAASTGVAGTVNTGSGGGGGGSGGGGASGAGASGVVIIRYKFQ